MPRVSRLFLAATLSSLAALLPVTAFADANTLTVSVVGAEYSFGLPCTESNSKTVGTTASFAGFGSAPPGGRVNAFFNTTICHTETDILAGGSFQLTTRQRTLVGQYNHSSGALVPGRPTPLGSTLCKQVTSVDATLTGRPIEAVPAGATNIISGFVLPGTGFLTHFGAPWPVCTAFAATIRGTATLVYP